MPTLPAPAQDASYWQSLRAAVPVEAGTAPLPRAVDYVVIGGGLAGVSTARAILAACPSASVIVLEAEFVGYGASGRNGGLLSPLPVPVWLLSARHGNAAAWGLKSLNARVNALGQTLAASMPSSEPTQTRLQLQAMGALTSAGLRQIARVLDHAGIDHETQRASGRDVLSLPAFVVNPYELVVALGADARRRGICIHERTSVASVAQHGAGARVTTVQGQTIDARCAVVCTNAYTGSLDIPAGARKARPVRNFMRATEPLPADLCARLGSGHRFVVEIDKSYVFYRLHHGRLVYGGIESLAELRGSDFGVPPGILEKLAGLVQRSLGAACPPIARAWSGRYHATLTDTPIIARHARAPAIVMNVGYGGTGVALSQIFADRAAAIATGLPVADPDAARLGEILAETRLPVGGLVAFGASIARQLLPGVAPPF